MGAAAWYYGWREHQHQELAGALLAAHLIECGPYVVGANFSGFKDFLPELVDLAFPVAEIARDGGCVISKTAEGGGHVTRHTVTAQLLYELQGHLYLNPDVVADLSDVRVEEQKGPGEDRVRVCGAKGLPPPPTTKVMFAAEGGYQAEATFYINRLDVDEKVAIMKNQLAYVLKDANFSRLSIEQYGTHVRNPSSQQAGMVQLRAFAQARKKDTTAVNFKVPIYAVRMQSYPGYHMSLDFRTMDPKVHARSGDKADNSNVGFFVRNEDEYLWLRALLTVSRLKQLLGDDWFESNPGRRVERVDSPGINAVHL
ncbi:DUF1446-domain-containing protein [Colletotrichum caudatum]|nr:DUF1446-domain-containing protein [Colletotrichum caudatum]